ncbi:hypothetical protein [Streptomyces sp. NPDC127084]|uniref:hypothetical protein n=1 Tax=Streptomyces sp. NPDC127084 TaxID=3347133 RepID=UPI0036686E25
MDLQLKDRVAFGREGAHVTVGSRSTTPELAALHGRYGVAAVPVGLSTADGPDTLVRLAVGSTGHGTPGRSRARRYP